MMIEQNSQAQLQLNLTIESLRQMNNTVSSLVNVIDSTKRALEERLAWITEILGGTDVSLERLYVAIWHFCFLIGAMILCAFLNATIYTRMMVFVLLPLNMALNFNDSEQYLNPISLVLIITLFAFGKLFNLLLFLKVLKRFSFLAQTIIVYALNFKQKKVATLKHMPEDKYARDCYKTNNTDYFNETTTTFDDIEEEIEAPTPPLSRNGILDDSLRFLSPTPSLSYRNGQSRSRSRTPLLNKSFRSSCQANTRLGTPCKLSSLPGRDYCHRHQSGDSIIG